MAARRVVVVGGGISGLVFAIAAARHNGALDVEVIERRAEGGAGAAGIGLHPIALRCLDRIGVGAAVRAVSVELDAYYVLTTGGEAVMQPYAEIWGQPTLSVHRADLGDVLLDSAPPNMVTMGASVDGIEVRSDGVEVTLSDGSRRSADLVVGADGVRSTVRSRAVGGGFTVYGGATFWRTTLPSRIVDRATMIPMQPAASLGLIPLHGERTHCFVQRRVPEASADPVMGRRQRLQDFLSFDLPLVAAVRDLLPGDDEIHFGLLEWVAPPTWGVSRAVLIGDAAHAMAPTLALGGAMAIEDAVVLADELANVDNGLDVAVDRFRTRRDPRVRFVQSRTDVTFRRYAGEHLAGEPTGVLEFYRRNYEPLLAEP